MSKKSANGIEADASVEFSVEELEGMAADMVEAVEETVGGLEEAVDDMENAVEKEEGDAFAAVAQIQQALVETQDQLLRQAAEFQNFRRRKDKELEQRLTNNKARMLTPFLDVLDDFRRSLEAATQEEAKEGTETGPSYQALKTGVEMVYQKFSDELKKLGVEAIEAEGLPFDENLHEALMQQPAPDDDTPSGTVLQELQRGYRLGERVLRHTKVIVAQ